jgi:uncharacterized membrane protein YeaQ/YmgE (transglycosylase-associated protein family)
LAKARYRATQHHAVNHKKKETFMEYIWTALIGFIAGLVARAVHPGKDDLGIIMTIVLGIAGSFIATYLGQAVGWYKQGESAGFIMSVIGAVVLLVIYGFIVKKKDGGSAST